MEVKFLTKMGEYVMILVLLGTQNNQFTRLLQEIEKCIDNGTINQRVVVQAGFTKFESSKMNIFDLKPREVVENLADEAEFIITHGGVGSILMAIKKNKKVIAVPRLSEFNEHVNDHQRQIVEIFNDKGYIIGVQNIEDLSEAIKQIDEFKPKPYSGDNSKMLNIIENFIDKL